MRLTFVCNSILIKTLTLKLMGKYVKLTFIFEFSHRLYSNRKIVFEREVLVLSYY